VNDIRRDNRGKASESRFDAPSRTRVNGLQFGVLPFVPEDRQIFPNLTTRENLLAAASKRPRCGPFVDAGEGRGHLPRLIRTRHLSGGEQQMLAIGRALMTSPRLLALDEAAEGLMPRSARRPGPASRHSTGRHRQERRSLIEIADRHYVVERGHIT
jgi:branched-chain amino acid transport system ATP-binding protein